MSAILVEQTPALGRTEGITFIGILDGHDGGDFVCSNDPRRSSYPGLGGQQTHGASDHDKGFHGNSTLVQASKRVVAAVGPSPRSQHRCDHSIGQFENEQRPAFRARGKDPFAGMAEKRWGRLQPTCNDRDVLLAIKLVGDRALTDTGPSIELP
jgi:hypothetical protein